MSSLGLDFLEKKACIPGGFGAVNSSSFRLALFSLFCKETVSLFW